MIRARVAQAAPERQRKTSRARARSVEIGVDGRPWTIATPVVASWAMRSPNPIRAVALFEAAKGVLVLVAGIGALSLIHHDVQHVAEQLLGHLHLNPAKPYPRIFIDAAKGLTDTRLWLFAGLAAVYALVRLIEAYGLWRARRWAEWFAVISGGIYLPFEIYECIHAATWLSAAALVVNGLVVASMIHALRRDSQRPSHARDGA